MAGNCFDFVAAVSWCPIGVADWYSLFGGFLSPRTWFEVRTNRRRGQATLFLLEAFKPSAPLHLKFFPETCAAASGMKIGSAVVNERLFPKGRITFRPP